MCVVAGVGTEAVVELTDNDEILDWMSETDEF